MLIRGSEEKLGFLCSVDNKRVGLGAGGGDGGVGEGGEQAGTEGVGGD